MMRITTALTPELWVPGQHTGQRVAIVVIDVLRAGTTLCAALGKGSELVIPCETVEEAQQCAHSLRGSSVRVALAGERGGVAPEGFDLGNSPVEMSAAETSQVVVMTTTNGTRAVRIAHEAGGKVLIGCFSNLSRVAEYLCAKSRELREVVLLCAGSHGAVSWEDTLFAGALATRLQQKVPSCSPCDSTRIAAAQWSQHGFNAAEALLLSSHARTLQDLGFGDDILFAATPDTYRLVPVFNGRGFVSDEEQQG